MQFIFNSLEKFCDHHGLDRTYFVAFSGGLDSTVLLHLLINLRPVFPIKLHVVHIHHGLSQNASSWATHCEKICNDFSVDFSLFHVDAKSITGQSPEEVARQRRYEVFKSLMQPDDIVLTAHHQDDQAETVLLQLFRGSGPKGLAAMSPFIAFHQGFLGRPLLAFSREKLKNYAEQNQLHWIEDESNTNTDFTRNFLRHEVLSLLKTRWPSIQETLSRTAEHCAEAQMLIENFSQQDFLACSGSKPNTLSIKKILEFDLSRQRQIIRLWLSQNRYPTPSTLKMQHILNDVLHAREDRSPLVIWGGVELRRYRDDIYVMKRLQKIDVTTMLPWDLQQTLLLPDSRKLKTNPVMGKGLKAEISAVSVRFRQGGEELQFGNHHHSLKNLFQEWGVPSWERERIPLLFVNRELAVVVGYAIADKFKANNNEMGLEIESSSL